MINLEAFRKRFEAYKKMDYANNYYSFWRWKVGIESNDAHILDKEHLSITHEKLKSIMKAWQTYRPKDSTICLRRLEPSLKYIAPIYDEIREIDLLSFPEAPRDKLKEIWQKLGRVKEDDGAERSFSDYFVVAVTKPLMFLWGQTLAFDDLVRTSMPPSRYHNVTENRWTFTLWHNVMEEYHERTLEQPDFIELSREICLEEFGTSDFVPYGQFLDLYYWVGAKCREL